MRTLIKRVFGIGDSEESTAEASARGSHTSTSVPEESQQFVVCRYCQRKVRHGVRHQCQSMRDRRVPARSADDEDEGFFVSFMIAHTTDNWGLGYMGGGNLMGSILGEALREDGYEEDIPPEHVMEIDPEEAFIEPASDIGPDARTGDDGQSEDPVIAIDPDGETPISGEEASAESTIDVDDTPGDSADSY